MSVNLVLDKPPGHFTNLDIVTGRVQLRLTNSTQITSITVKLEGESRTRLLSPGIPELREKPRPVLEVHKLLYKVLTVWPPDGTRDLETRINYSLLAGQYEYPFRFKIPFNNACSTINKSATRLGFFGFSLEVHGIHNQHVKATLPPSIYFPGEAEIRYYIKVTVNRPGIMRENPRHFTNLNFVPIEPPRPLTDGETYARRQTQFNTNSYIPNTSWERKSSNGFKGLFSKSPSTPTSPISFTPSAPSEPARFTVDARLPNPAILTCGEEVPLRIIIKQLNARVEPLYLQTLQIELIGKTIIRAEDATRTETHSWVITSMSNMEYAIGAPADDAGTETELSKEFWAGRPLPNTVAPSFVTCNIRRTYELLVSVGLCFGSYKNRDQFVVLPLRSKVEIYSGIRPPDALLKRMANAPPRPGSPTRPNQQNQEPAQLRPAVPAVGMSSSAQQEQQDSAALPPVYDEPPPSYEDAIASDLPPVDGPRPDYAPPPAPEGESNLVSEKR